MAAMGLASMAQGVSLGSALGCVLTPVGVVPPGGSVGADGSVLDASGAPVLGADGAPLKLEVRPRPTGGGAVAAAVAASLAATTNARYTGNKSAGNSWTSLSKCSGDRAAPRRCLVAISVPALYSSQRRFT